MVGQHANPWLRQLVRFPFYLLALTVFIPYYFLVTNSFKPVDEILRRPPPLFIENPTLKNFYNPVTANMTDEEKAALNKEQQKNPDAPRQWYGFFERIKPSRFLRYLLNSVGVTALIVFVKVILGTLAAYVFVRKPFPGSGFIFMVMLASMMIPEQVTWIPNFLLVKQFGLLNNTIEILPYLALTVPFFADAFAVFFFRQSILKIPTDLFDAARIDGASELRIWWQVVIPLLRPAIASVAILLTLWNWNVLIWPLIVVRDDLHVTLPLMIAQLAGSFASDPTSLGVIMVAALVTSLPALVFFVVFQRQFVEGIASGATKG